MPEGAKNHMNQEKALRKLLAYPSWIPSLRADELYQRSGDDHDGKPESQILSVMFDRQGDAYIKTFTENPMTTLRYRTMGGGGSSLRVRNALMILAYAIQLDNESKRGDDTSIMREDYGTLAAKCVDVMDETTHITMSRECREAAKEALAQLFEEEL